MKIALDAMGGDNAPGVVIEGALLAKKSFADSVQIILVGNEEVIKAELAKRGSSEHDFAIVHASEVIGMAEHPAKAVAQKQDSSIVVGYKLLMAGKADAFCSAGNTGAMLVAAMFTIKTIEGVIRPGIAGFIPKTSNRYGVLLDVGANAEVKPEVLAQFALMGSFYAQYVLGIENPKVGLLNLGEEQEKGTAVLQASHQLIKQNSKVNFVGNIEGRRSRMGSCFLFAKPR
jgi:glycerol-3-phosphate acyltransferase PlsX